jgi:hypothetical protein
MLEGNLRVIANVQKRNVFIHWVCEHLYRAYNVLITEPQETGSFPLQAVSF